MPYHKPDDGEEQAARVDFPIMLYDMLDEISPPNASPEFEGDAEACSWMPHGRSFRVHRPPDFETRVMPRYFTERYGSFRHLLEQWGFLRLSRGRDRGAYFNFNFVRGSRKPLIGATKERMAEGMPEILSRGDDPDFYDAKQWPPIIVKQLRDRNSRRGGGEKPPPIAKERKAGPRGGIVTAEREEGRPARRVGRPLKRQREDDEGRSDVERRRGPSKRRRPPAGEDEDRDDDEDRDQMVRTTTKKKTTTAKKTKRHRIEDIVDPEAAMDGTTARTAYADGAFVDRQEEDPEEEEDRRRRRRRRIRSDRRRKKKERRKRRKKRKKLDNDPGAGFADPLLVAEEKRREEEEEAEKGLSPEELRMKRLREVPLCKYYVTAIF